MTQIEKATNEKDNPSAEVLGEETVSQQVTEEPAPVHEGEKSSQPERRKSVSRKKSSKEKVTFGVKLQHREITHTVIYGDGHGDIFM